MNPTVPHLTVLGVRVARLTRTGALETLVRLHDTEAPATVAFVNAHTLNLASRDPAFRDVLNRTSLVLNDGAGLALAAKVQGAQFPENLNGTDLTPQLLTLSAARGWGVYFLGAKPGVAARAAEALSARIPGLRVVGSREGYYPPTELERVKDAIRASHASVLVVAMGNPLQERWLDAHLRDTGCRLGVGVGAFFDFAAGAVNRAPAWMRTTGIEWLYRLSQEPRRMWRRYVMGNPAFVARVLWERMRAS